MPAVAIETVIIIIVVVSFAVLAAIIFALYWLWHLLLEDRRCSRLNSHTFQHDWHRHPSFGVLEDASHRTLLGSRVRNPRINRRREVCVDERSRRIGKALHCAECPIASSSPVLRPRSSVNLNIIPSVHNTRSSSSTAPAVADVNIRQKSLAVKPNTSTGTSDATIRIRSSVATTSTRSSVANISTTSPDVKASTKPSIVTTITKAPDVTTCTRYPFASTSKGAVVNTNSKPLDVNIAARSSGTSTGFCAVIVPRTVVPATVEEVLLPDMVVLDGTEPPPPYEEITS